jgi:hypothetical protein
LGKPVWTVLSYVPDWRWLLEGETTPWYPTMRFFGKRKGRAGDGAIGGGGAEFLVTLASLHLTSVKAHDMLSASFTRRTICRELNRNIC